MPLLEHPQLYLDYLVPTGREKFRLDEVSAMAGSDGEPVSVQSIRNMIEAGKAFGNRFNFRSAPGQEERCRVQWMTRPDVLQLFLSTRTAAPDVQLQQLFGIVSTLSPEALALLRQHAERTYVRKVNRI